MKALLGFPLMFLSFLIFGKDRTERWLQDIADGYADEIDRMRSMELRIIFDSLDLEAENYRLMKASGLDMLDVEVASMTVSKVKT